MSLPPYPGFRTRGPVARGERTGAAAHRP
jgi:hypothetical protein